MTRLLFGWALLDTREWNGIAYLGIRIYLFQIMYMTSNLVGLNMCIWNGAYSVGKMIQFISKVVVILRFLISFYS